MSDKSQIISIDNIQNRILTIRGIQVMLDSDLAEMYGVEIRVLNQAVKRNTDRFPEKFRFQLTKQEFKLLRSQIATIENTKSNLRSQNDTSVKEKSLRSQFVTLENQRGKHRKYFPYVFTEQGVSMLSAVLRSETAIKVSIQIIDAFVEMRKFLSTNATIFQRLNNVEQKQIETDTKIHAVLNALEAKELKPKQGVFYDGQIFDAYVFVADLIKSAEKSILLIDNYIDESVLQLFTKRKKNVTVNIYTKNILKILRQDLEKHNSQYPKIEIQVFTKAHDRFLIIDDKELYHFGASLKDLGKKWFAFSKMEMDALDLMAKLKSK